ncbi:MAG: type secretory pathway VirD4 component-like protein [Gammaproteobacteria bacterium]|jgi:hypothetical protein|nr:type secretory pathway VirD4 component-like protein [Gammaproteobacteria bacterium]
MKEKGVIDDYINGHPREVLKMVLIVVGLLWQSSMVVAGLLLYGAAHFLKSKKWILYFFSGFFSLEIIWYFDQNIATFGQEGFAINRLVWKKILSGDIWFALCYMYYKGLPYMLSVAPLFATLLWLIDAIPSNPHETILRNLGKGKHFHELAEIPERKVNQLLQKAKKEEALSGTFLGISKQTGSDLVIPDKDVNQIILVLGTTGGGKTITLRRFYQRAISKHYPLIIIDGKPSPHNVAWLQKLSEKNGRSFFGFNCGNYFHYDCLHQGGFTELKDKIISLKDQWENDYYRSIAEDYLQTAFEVLLQSKETFDLKRVAECLDHDELTNLARETGNKKLWKRVGSLESYERKDITGLQAHLHLLIHSELGQFFERDDNMFNLTDAIQQKGVVYFALPALRFPNFSKILGKLVINDLKAVIDRLNANYPIFTVFDEFSVFAGEQVLNLVNMGREKGVHAIFGTQGLADLRKVDPVFLGQVLNCANTLICHRLNDHESAESISNWIGTKETFSVTAQISQDQGTTGLGTVKRNKEFIIHPDWIKQNLQTGDAFYVTKIGQFRWDKVKIKLMLLEDIS